MRVRGLDRDTTERTLRALDRTHADYLRQFYDVDILDPGLYHLVIDATSFSADVCVDLIATAADPLTLSES
jgi:cytidylate kinase